MEINRNAPIIARHEITINQRALERLSSDGFRVSKPVLKLRTSIHRERRLAASRTKRVAWIAVNTG